MLPAVQMKLLLMVRLPVPPMVPLVKLVPPDRVLMVPPLKLVVPTPVNCAVMFALTGALRSMVPEAWVNLAAPVPERLSAPAVIATPPVPKTISLPELSVTRSVPRLAPAVITMSLLPPSEVMLTASCVAPLVMMALLLSSATALFCAIEIAPLLPVLMVWSRNDEPAPLLIASGLADVPIEAPCAVTLMLVPLPAVLIMSLVAVPLVTPPAAVMFTAFALMLLAPEKLTLPTVETSETLPAVVTPLVVAALASSKEATFTLPLVLMLRSPTTLAARLPKLLLTAVRLNTPAAFDLTIRPPAMMRPSLPPEPWPVARSDGLPPCVSSTTLPAVRISTLLRLRPAPFNDASVMTPVSDAPPMLFSAVALLKMMPREPLAPMVSAVPLMLMATLPLPLALSVEPVMLEPFCINTPCAANEPRPNAPTPVRLIAPPFEAMKPAVAVVLEPIMMPLPVTAVVPVALPVPVPVRLMLPPPSDCSVRPALMVMPFDWAPVVSPVLSPPMPVALKLPLPVLIL